MAKFNFIDVSGEGYSFVWRERSMLMRLAALPVMIKITSFAVVYWLGFEDNFLRQGLVFLPSYFAEGWLLAYAIRMAVLGESWTAASAERYRSITASMVLYVLIKIMMAVSVGSAMEGKDLTGKDVPPVESSGETLILSFILLVMLVWGFRFLWYYVPLAMGIKLSDFWRHSKSISTSFYMMGTWLLCFAPMVFVLLVLSGLMREIFPDVGDEFSGLYVGAMSVVQSIVELIILLVSSVAMAYGVSQMMGSKR